MMREVRRLVAVALAALCVGAMAAPLAAAETTTAGAPARASNQEGANATVPATTPAPSAIGQSGLIAIYDPATGELQIGGNSDEFRLPYDPELENALSTSSEGLEVVRLPNGALSLDHQGRFQTAVFALRAPDGTVSITESVMRAGGSPACGAAPVCREPSEERTGEEVCRASE